MSLVHPLWTTLLKKTGTSFPRSYQLSVNSSSVRAGDLLTLRSSMLECSLAWLYVGLVTYVYQYNYWCVWGSRYLYMGAVIRNIHTWWKRWVSHPTLQSPRREGAEGWGNHQEAGEIISCSCITIFLTTKGLGVNMRILGCSCRVKHPRGIGHLFLTHSRPFLRTLLFGFIIFILCTIVYLDQNKARWDLTKLEFKTC